MEAWKSCSRQDHLEVEPKSQVKGLRFTVHGLRRTIFVKQSMSLDLTPQTNYITFNENDEASSHFRLEVGFLGGRQYEYGRDQNTSL